MKVWFLIFPGVFIYYYEREMSGHLVLHPKSWLYRTPIIKSFVSFIKKLAINLQAFLLYKLNDCIHDRAHDDRRLDRNQ